jgi:hypothetical protein
VLVRSCPRPMCDVAFAGPIELRTLWIRAREASISLLDWRCQCHSGPPLRRIGPKDIDSTPVFPRYYSPGLPHSAGSKNLRRFTPTDSCMRGICGGSLFASLTQLPEIFRPLMGESVVPILPHAVKGKPSVLRTLDSGRLSTKEILSRPEKCLLITALAP